MSEEINFASRNQQDSQSGYSITDSMYSRADRIVYNYSKAVLGIVFGAYYFYECPANEKVPIAVIICFSIVLLTHLMNLAQDMRYILNSSVIEKPLCFRCLEVTLHVIMICIFFLDMDAVQEWDPRLFYDTSSNAIRDLPAGDASELSNLSDDDMALDDINYFEVFATDSGEEGSTSRQKRRIVIPESGNS